jgi:hypothetical protein
MLHKLLPEVLHKEPTDEGLPDSSGYPAAHTLPLQIVDYSTPIHGKVGARSKSEWREPMANRTTHPNSPKILSIHQSKNAGV